MSINDQMKLRLQLLANGYKPLPALCMRTEQGRLIRHPTEQGWPTVVINEEWLQSTDKQGRTIGEKGNVTTLRLDNLLAIDIDVDDEQLTTEWEWGCSEAALPHHYGALIRRRSNSPRFLALYLYEGNPVSGKAWLMNGKRQGIDVLHGSGRQFTAFGMHQSGVPYTWDNGTPLEVHADSLPIITEAEVQEFVEAAWSAASNLSGFEAIKHAGGGFSNTQRILKPTDVFEVVTPGVYVGDMTVNEMKEWTKGGVELTCNLTAIRPSSDSLGGLAKRGQGGDFIILDFVKQAAYLENTDIDSTDDIFKARAAKLEALKARAKPRRSLPLKPKEETENDIIVDDAAHHPDNTIDQYVMVGGCEAVHSRNPRNRFLLSYFANQYGKKAYRGWLKKAARVNAEIFRPDLGEGVIEINDPFYKTGERYLNIYRNPIDYEGGTLDDFHSFMESLVTNAEEREILYDWMAYKVRNPSLKLHALYFFSRGIEGCGRNTFFNILRSLLGPHYCKEVGFERIVGSEGQSQFNDFLMDCLLAFVSEAPQPKNQREQHEQHEKWKRIVQPFGSDEESIQAKHKALTFARLFTSFVFATNNPFALALTDNDRRAIAIENSVVLAGNHPIHNWRKSLENISALRRWLRARSCTAYDYTQPKPPLTASKRLIVAGSVSPLSSSLKQLQQVSVSDLVSIGNIVSWIRETVARDEITEFEEDDGKLKKALVRLIATLGMGRAKTVKIVTAEGVKPKAEKLVVLRNHAKWSDGSSATAKEVRTEYERGIYGDGISYRGQIVRDSIAFHE